MKKRLYAFIIALAGCLAAQASIVGYTNTFSSAGDTNGWVNVGTSDGVISRSVFTRDFNDGTTNVLYTVYTNDGAMFLTGDGVLGDGVLFFDILNTVVADEAMGYTLSGTINLGETITFSGNMCAGNSYNRFFAEIWDVTDSRLLVQAASIQVLGTGDTKYEPKDFSVSYTATAAEAGDTIQIRLREDARTVSAGRDLYVDHVAVTVIPEPATMSLIMIGLAGIPFVRHFLHR